MNELSEPGIALLIIGGLTFLFFLFISMSSYLEKEKRAVTISLAFSFSFASFFILLALFDSSANNLISWIVGSITIVITIMLTAPMDKKPMSIPETPCLRIDERDVVFSRVNIKEGDSSYADYYKAKPEKKAQDDKWRAAPRLLSPNTPYFHDFYSTKARAIFDEVDLLSDKVDGEISKFRQNLDVDEITKEVHKYARRLKAKHVSITRLKDYQLYSVKGRGDNYGKAIERVHNYAIVLTVEMDRMMNKTAPAAPTIFESAEKYLQSGEIAIEIASYIRKLGYSARAHIDANYELICPLVGRDAGLGEIGRMGILMSPELGPRFRISVVTTSLPLKLNKRIRDLSMIEFCRYCKKCATNCPANAIPKSEMKEIDGVNRWQINQDACFSYWKKVGTDCGKCMAVCPYSHPNTSFHRLVKRLIKRNILFRKLAVHMDDLFYGKYPKSYPVEKLTRAV